MLILCKILIVFFYHRRRQLHFVMQNIVKKAPKCYPYKFKMLKIFFMYFNIILCNHQFFHVTNGSFFLEIHGTWFLVDMKVLIGIFSFLRGIFGGIGCFMAGEANPTQTVI
jgi:hypothetical protein